MEEGWTVLEVKFNLQYNKYNRICLIQVVIMTSAVYYPWQPGVLRAAPASMGPSGSFWTAQTPRAENSDCFLPA